MTAKKAAAVLPGVLSGLRLDRRQVEAEVARVWNNLMAPDVVAHAQPTGMRKGTLFITVDSSVWLSEIVRYRRQEILDRLRHSFGPQFVKKLSFKLG
jgi:predicted nucleic acid-binding Zn ribbon protein